MVDMDFQDLPPESNHSTADSRIVDLDSENACRFLSNLTAWFLTIVGNFVSQDSEWEVRSFLLNFLPRF